MCIRDRFKRVFVLASSHRYSFSGAAVYGQGNYMTPLGELKTDTELETRLVSSHEVFRYYPEAHNHEHSLEVQLPFLQHWLGKDFLLVPVILGTDNPVSYTHLRGFGEKSGNRNFWRYDGRFIS